MDNQAGIYWIQGFSDGEWRNLRRCDDHDDAIARMGPLLTDRRYRELRLVLAQSQDGRIDYTTLVKARDGEVLSDTLLGAGPPPIETVAAKPVVASRTVRVAVLAGVLAVSVAGGLAIAKYNQPFAIAFYERAAALVRPDPPATETVAAAAIPEPSHPGRFFAAVDADDGDAMRRLMASRPSDLRLDELRSFVDDGWGTGPRSIVDYALLGGQLAAADALLSAGATPSDWLRGVITRNAGLVRLRPAIALLTEFGAGAANRDRGGN